MILSPYSELNLQKNIDYFYINGFKIININFGKNLNDEDTYAVFYTDKDNNLLNYPKSNMNISMLKLYQFM